MGFGISVSVYQLARKYENLVRSTDNGLIAHFV